MEAVLVGAQRIGQHEGIAAVILGAGWGVAIAESVHLLGVDGEHRKTVLEQSLHHGPARNFDGRRQQADNSPNYHNLHHSIPPLFPVEYAESRK